MTIKQKIMKFSTHSFYEANRLKWNVRERPRCGNYFYNNNNSLTSLTRAKCGTRSTLCWKVGNISGSTELFAL